MPLFFRSEFDLLKAFDEAGMQDWFLLWRYREIPMVCA